MEGKKIQGFWCLGFRGGGVLVEGKRVLGFSMDLGQVFEAYFLEEGFRVLGFRVFVGTLIE